MSATPGRFFVEDSINSFHSNGIVFNHEDQLYIMKQAMAAWQVGIVFGQVKNNFLKRLKKFFSFSIYSVQEH
jgi:hypothetical protein